MQLQTGATPKRINGLRLIVSLRTLAIGLCIVGIAACSEIKLAEQPPQPVDLSGEWMLDFAASENPDLLNAGANIKQPDRSPRSRRDARRLWGGSDLAFIAHDFQVLNADKMFIEQGSDSLGIQYDPGVYRDVSWGERDRGLWDVYAGWEETDMVIVSDATDMRVTERFDLVAPNTLKITILINTDSEDREIARIFDRRQ